jgi:putative ABC transport system ATP-binding protein/lipoprotein-releasing system ATP-binding protein
MEAWFMADRLVEGVAVARRFHQGEDDVVALRAASFVVQAGDRIAITGASGSGKSTLLHLIAGLDVPSSGELRWPAFGGSEPLRPRHISVVFQAASLIPSLSVVENVEFPLRLLDGGDDPRQSALEALDRLALADLADQLPDALSGGQAQRVGLARAMATNPRLLLADEPTGQVDQHTGQQMMHALLHAIEGTDAALIVCTHDPNIARHLGSVWTMDHGQLHVPAGARP